MEITTLSEVGENTVIAKIGTENFIEYLSGKKQTSEGLLRGKFEDFEKQIELPEGIHQTIKEMYEQKRETPSAAPTVEDLKEEILVQHLNKLVPGLGNIFVSKKFGTLEQARMVYKDDKTGDIRPTDPVYGGETEVSFLEPFVKAKANNGIPVIEIHTHPEDANFSQVDYAPVLLYDTDEKVRLLKAIMVLLPNSQIMAVATKDTPLFADGYKLQNFLNSYGDELGQEVTDIAKASLKKINNMLGKKKAVNVAKAIKDNLENSSHNAVAVIDSQQLINREEEIQKQIETEMKEGPDEAAKVMNSSLLSFGREINVKLYFSQDMRTFKEFSA